MKHYIGQTRPTWLPTRNTHAAEEKNTIKVVIERHRRHSSPSKRFRLHLRRPQTKSSPQPTQKTMSAYAKQSTQSVEEEAAPTSTKSFTGERSTPCTHGIRAATVEKVASLPSLPTPRHAAPTSQLHSGTQRGLSVTKDKPRPGSAHHRHRCHTARNATKAPKTSSAAANHDVECA